MKPPGTQHGAICRTLRTLKGWTQAHAADVAGGPIDNSAVSRFESSPADISVRKLVRVFAALGADIVVKDRESGIEMKLDESKYKWPQTPVASAVSAPEIPITCECCGQPDGMCPGCGSPHSPAKGSGRCERCGKSNGAA